MTFKEYIKDHNISIDIRYLNCSHEDLTDLKGIEYLTDMEQLECNNNKLTNLPELSNLKKLSHLTCSENLLTNLDDISSLNNLCEIICYNNPLVDIKGILNLKINYFYSDITSNTKEAIKHNRLELDKIKDYMI